MKALLMKDCCVLWRRMRIFLLLVLVFSAVPGVFQNTFAITYAAMIPYAVFSVDETSKWDTLASMMPYSAKDMVLSKYLLGGITLMAALVSTLVLSRLVGIFTGAEATPIHILLAAACVSVLLIDLTLPMVFHFGVEKARLTMVLLIAGVCGSAGALSGMVDSSALQRFSPGFALLPIAAVAATCVSIPLSVRMYKGRDQ